MKQEFEKYTEDEATIWRILFKRQWENLQSKGSQTYMNSLLNMNEVLSEEQLPNFEKINNWFTTRTGWSIACVPGLIPVDEFFELLSQKQFCSSTWLRSMENLDYLEEPDMFHDTFGHIPLLSDPIFSKFLHAFGRLGVKEKNNLERVIQLQRLYWFTIEFGLIREKGELKVYGAGIASSFGETNLAVSDSVTTAAFDLEVILKTTFETDKVQNHYFVIDSYEQLFEAIKSLDKKWNNYELERK